jgi:hypothetical protein
MSRVQLAALSSDELLDALAASERALAAVQAEQLQILALLEQRPSSVSVTGYDDRHWVREQVACVLRSSPEFAGNRLREAVSLARLRHAVEFLAAGKVCWAQLRVLADKLSPLDEQAATAVAAQVLPRAGEQTYTAFRAAVHRAVLRLAPKTDAKERVANVADRRVCFSSAGAGVTSMWAVLPEEQAAAIEVVIRKLAGTSTTEDERGADQRRADALVQLMLSPSGEQLHGDQPLRPAVNVCVALSTLLGLDDEPGELAGVGPIPAALARRLAADPTGTWRRLVTDPAGRLIDYGRRVYQPPPALADHIVARDRTCRFPGCTRASESSEIDHRIAWADGGRTNEANLHALCPRHHHLKHETRWQVTRLPEHTTAWTDSRGRTYYQSADTYPIDTTITNHEQARGSPAKTRGSPTTKIA